MRNPFQITSIAGWAAFLSLLCAGMMTSCDKEDELETTPLSQPSSQLSSSSVSSLTFTWGAIENASQYAYELTDASGNVVAGDVTAATTASFTGLKADTEYVLTVWAYGVYGSEYGTSPVATLTARTPAIVQLSTPEVTVSTEDGIKVSWTAIEGAYYYEYAYTDEDGNVKDGWTYDDSVTLTGLTSGSYTFTVYAVAKSSDEAHSDSEKGSVTFSVERQELWRVTGDFVAGSETTTCELVAYDDGTYSLVGWYGKEGTQLDFSVNDDKSLNVLNPDYYTSGGYYWFYDYDAYAYYAGLWPFYDSTSGTAYSEFDGDAKAGSLWCYDYYSGYITFTWGSSEEDSVLWRVTGEFSLNYGQNPLGERELVAYKDGHYSLKSWFGVEGYDLDFTVNGTEMVITNAASSSGGYFYVDHGDATQAYSNRSLYTSSGYSCFEGDEASGYFYVWDYDSYDYMLFQWTGSSESSFIDELVGSWEQTTSCMEYNYDKKEYETNTYTNEVTIAKLDDTTVTVTGIYASYSVLNATVNEADKTLTFAPQTWMTYYTFASENSTEDSVTATVSDGLDEITMSGYTDWYSGYACMYYATTTLTKKATD